MRMVDIITKKRDGQILSKEEINYFVNEYTNGNIPDYQASAFLMAIYFQEMNEDERTYLTMAMANSGNTVDLSKIAGIKVDKHSTGGVGDTTTLVLGPLVAAVGAPVAKMSGRGLGHTGGTIDKFEAIPGFNTEVSINDFINQVNKDQIAIIGQSENLAPADKKIYALRDVTGSVNSISLIASSIMSKKIAAGADAIVLDVKTGAGALLKTFEESKALAYAMVNIGKNIGRKTVAILSDMSQPLGFAIGNTVEVKEAIATLKGQGPADLHELVITLGSQMVLLANKANTLNEARQLLETAMKNGNAIAKFKNLVDNQGGDSTIIDYPERLPEAKYKIELPAKKTGIISQIIADRVGITTMQLGAGRADKNDNIDVSVGIVLHKKVGDAVHEGESLLTIHSNNKNIETIKQQLYDSLKISNNAEIPELIQMIITE